jgi:hypothetical protein
MIKEVILSMCFAGSHLTRKSFNTGETKSKPLSNSRCILKLLAAVYLLPLTLRFYPKFLDRSDSCVNAIWLCPDSLPQFSSLLTHRGIGTSLQ